MHVLPRRRLRVAGLALVAYGIARAVAAQNVPPASTPVAPAAAPADDVAIGHQIFSRACSRCHHRGGIGGNLAGRHGPARWVRMTVREGADGMPTFSPRELSGVGLTRLIAYLRSIGTVR